MNVLQVFIFRQGRFFGTECFAQGQIIMGRSPDVDLLLDDDMTSRSHASLEVTAEGMVLEDLASSNGTYVNGEPVERCYVSSRDEVSIGSFTLKFKLLSQSKPKGKFSDETRVVAKGDVTEVVAEPGEDQDPVIRDETEVLSAHDLRAVREQKKDMDAGGIREVGDRKAEIAQALSDELQDESEPDAPSLSTERLQRPPEVVNKQSSQDKGPGLDSNLDTGVALHDNSTRWLTPEPTDGPSLQLANELEPEEPRVQKPDPLSMQPQIASTAHMSTESREPEPVPQTDWMQPEPPSAESFGVGGSDPSWSGSSVHAEDYDEEDEEAQPNFVEPFSLLNNIIRENFSQPQVPTLSSPVMEIIDYSSDKDVLGYHQVSKGKKYRIGPDRFVLAHYNDRAGGRILFNDEFSGGVITGDQTVPLDDLKNPSNQVGKKKGKPIYAYKLLKGDYANVIHSSGGSFIRFVNPPSLPPPRFKFRLDPLDLKIFGGSFFGTVLVIVLMGLLGGRKEAVASADLDRFAKVDIKDLQMEKKEEEIEVPLDQLPEPEKKEEEKVEEKKEEEKPKEKPKKQKPKRNRKRSKKKGGGGGEKASGGGVGMMAALGNLNQKKSSQNIVAAVTNLDAVRVPGGRSRYKVSGLVTKLPSSSVVTSRGRGVGVKGGIELLRGGKGRGGRAGIGPGALGGGMTGRRKVGGVVFKAPKRKMRVRGTLSREAIAKVVRKHLRQIQYCYEKNLLLNPKLAGKLMMEWTISTSGSVSVVKTKINSMATPAVAMCVSANIKKWKFPKPKGGIVVVSYPFIFNSIGF